MTKTSESKLTAKKATKSAKSEQKTLPTKNISSKDSSINIQDRHLQEKATRNIRPITAKPALPLKITNARENNLKSISLELPHNSYIGVTGLSGSGKSSLAFDTVYAEGQRRYIETFSPYTRQFFDKVKKPDVDLIENVRPAIAIQQKTRVSNSRSTVGSLTDINDYLKILWANLSVAVCPECKIELKSWTPENLASLIGGQKHKVGTTYLLSAKIELPDPKSKNYKKEVGLVFEKLSQQGFTRVFLPNSEQIIKIEDLEMEWQASVPAMKNLQATISTKVIYIVLDRIRITEDFSKTFDKRRIQEAIKTAFILSDGSCSLIEQNASRFAFNWVDADNKIHKKPTFRVIEYFETPRCPSLTNSIKFQKPKQSLFSYNHPLGACADCKGFGHILTLDLDLCIPDQSKTLSEKCIVSWATDSTKREHNELIKFCAENKIPINVPWRELSQEHQDLIYNAKTKNFWGLKHWFGWIEKRTYKMHYRIYLAKYRTQRVCETCNGTRLKRDALVYRIDGKTIADIWKIPVEEVYIWLQEIFKSKKAEETRALKDVYKAILARFKYLIDLGLGYLTLERQARTLSGGETQRVNLASAIGSELTSTQFVLDEPSVGLHARDSDRLTKSIKELHLRGNSVLAVEHDPDFLYASDYILELGPKSGKEGGEITFFDSSKKWQGIEFSQSVINTNKQKIDQNTKLLKIRSYSDKNITLRNIKDLKLDIPLQRVVCLTGVSGSGKSTLVKEIIEKGYVKKKKGEEVDFEIEGLENFEQVLLVDQSPLAKSPRANIATYSGIWDTVRDILSKEESALSRGLTRSSFSFNVNAGRCTNCDGAGFIKEDMQFLSDVYIPCENCLGTRFQQTVLDVTYKEKNVHQILNTSIDECVEFFSEYINIVRSANYLSRLGLGHLTLGHSLSELSGGEAQRLKLVPFIERSSKSKSLLIFDEPTTGLHIKDIEKFIYLLRDLRDEGHSILCIEHNLSLILSSDWIIDLGPEGGKGGGKLVLQGTPEFVIEYGESHTANYLREYKKNFYSEKNSKKNLNASSTNIDKTATNIIDTTASNITDTTSIEIKGARVHNLKNIDVKIPLNTIVAFTGVSGSGKSSIAKDIIYSEGQRRYLDCLSPYARQFIKGLERPDIDEIKNILPTVCVHQHTFQPGNLSTVGTVSEVYNFLRLLFAKTGDTYCPDHPEQKIDIFSAEKISAEIKSLGNKQIKILAPIIKQKKGNHKTVFERAIASEITEVRCDKIFARPGFFEEGLEKSKVHSIDFVIGKFIAQNVDLDITTDAVNQALALGGGELIVHYDNKDHIYSSERACPVCKRGFFKADPEDLSFNSKRGRCKKCGGTGNVKEKVCPECAGSRLNEIGRNIRINKENIFEICNSSPTALINKIQKLELSTNAKIIGEPVIKELVAKLKTLSDMGLNHITLNRDCHTLSGGELQRLRLATAMGSPLSGVLYIFDEPSVGLHPFDNQKVLAKLSDINNKGNSVILIEHDEDSILFADHIIEVGPGGGAEGGKIIFNGKTNDWDINHSYEIDNGNSKLEIEVSTQRKADKSTLTQYLTLNKCSKNTIKDISIDIPTNKLVTVAGLSGTGKSTLVHEIIFDILTNGKEEKEEKSGSTFTYKNNTIKLSKAFSKVIQIDQTPIGKTSRSTPASYLGIWDEIRKLYANTIEAKTQGWTASKFSYNSGDGRCPDCKGLGTIKLEMNFLADAKIHCETCNGKRYKDEIQAVKFSDLSVSDVLGLTFKEAKEKFYHHRKIHRAIFTACELGLGYLTLGQSSNSLSGGEAQRIKLVSELSRDQTGNFLYILDEPTTGLHKKDVALLIKTLKKLVELGNSVILIEHDLDVIKASDWIIEMGPYAGDQGGKVVFQGTFDKLSKAKTAWGTYMERRAPARLLESPQINA